MFGFSIDKGPTDERLHPLLKTAKLVWSNQLTQPPCLVIYVKFPCFVCLGVSNVRLLVGKLLSFSIGKRSTDELFLSTKAVKSAWA